MNLSTTLLGSTAVKQLQAAQSAWVLEVGKDRLTRAELAAVGCYNFVAARHLSHALKQTSVESLQQLYQELAPRDLAVPHLGVISFAVLGAAFEAKGIGGDAPLEAWARKHAKTLVTFHTLKAREQAQLAKARAAKRSRTRRRQHQAHGLRLARFTARQAHHGAA